MFLCGVYDVFRVFRLRRTQRGIVLFVCDFAFCMVATIAMLLLFFNLSYGKARAYGFLFALLGFLLWRFTVSKIYMALILKIIVLTEKLLTSIKMRVLAVALRLARRTYTEIYCRSLVNKSRKGFGIVKDKRKELKNDKETYTG